MWFHLTLTHWGRHQIDAISQTTFSNAFFENENEWISPRISLKFVPKVRVNNIPALVQIMAWRRPGDKPLSEPMMVSLLTHICVTRPQWVKSLRFSYTAIGSDDGFGLDNGLAPTRRQAIIWTNADSIHWRIYVALGGNELIEANLAYFIHITSPRGNGVIKASGLIHIFHKINTAVGKKFTSIKMHKLLCSVLMLCHNHFIEKSVIKFWMVNRCVYHYVNYTFGVIYG